jgi:small subunit ribosomal protein S2
MREFEDNAEFDDAADMVGIGQFDLHRRLDPRGLSALRSTMQSAFEVVADGGFIVFMGFNNKTRNPAVAAALESCQAFLGRWKPGLLKDWGHYIERRNFIDKALSDDLGHRSRPTIRRLKQEKRRIEKMMIAGNASERPRLICAFDVDADHGALAEARNLGIPVAAVVRDTAHVHGITFVLSGEPAYHFYGHMIARAAREGITHHIGLRDNFAAWHRSGKAHIARYLMNTYGRTLGTVAFEDAVVGRWLRPAAHVPDNRSVVQYGQLAPIIFGDFDPGANPSESDEPFAPTSELTEMVYRGLLAHADRLSLLSEGLQETLRVRAHSILAPRILEGIASRARRMIDGVLPVRPLLSEDGFDYGFVIELSESIPFRKDYPFFEQLRVELTEFLARGGSISGSWGRLRLQGSAVEFVLTAPKAIPETTWEKPSRIEWN